MGQEDERVAWRNDSTIPLKDEELRGGLGWKKGGAMPERSWLIGIVGGSGSGKTSIAQELIRRLQVDGVNVLLLDIDAYYAPLEVVKHRFEGKAINWDHPHAFDLELMATHLASLRAKVEPDPNRPRFLKTVHGVGYRLELAGKEER